MIMFSRSTLKFLGKQLGSAVSRSTSISPINGIDFDVGSFELEDGRSFFVFVSYLDNCVFQTKRYIENGDCVAVRIDPDKKELTLIDRITGEKIIHEDCFIMTY